MKIGGPEVIRALIVPNLKEYENLLREAIESMNDNKRKEGEMLIDALLEALLSLDDGEGASLVQTNGLANGHAAEMKAGLSEKVGSLLAEKLFESGRPRAVRAVMEC